MTMMITPRTSHTCTECSDITTMIGEIDCKMAKLASNLYNNVVFMLNYPIPGDAMIALLHYKRILMCKWVNSQYAVDYTLDMIASRVNLLKFR